MIVVRSLALVIVLVISISEVAVSIVQSDWVQDIDRTFSQGTVSAIDNATHHPRDQAPATTSGSHRARKLGALPEKIPEESRAKLTRLETLPTHFDWTNQAGYNWMTSVKDQANCGSCVAFGSVAALEGQLRIQANNPSWSVDLSETHLFSCGGGSCSVGWYISAALTYLQQYGTPDEACSPYHDWDVPCSSSCSNWQSRALKISSWHWLATDPASIQAALLNGPLVARFDVYTDFFYYTNGIYSHTWGVLEGGHAIAIVGYDSAQSYWIVKNSWGADWGENGYFRIGFGQVGIEQWVASITAVLPNSPPVITGLSVDKSSPQLVGSTITFTATATDPDGDTVLYRFYRLKSGGSWTIVRDWSSLNTYAWTPSETGNFQFAVWVRDGYHQGVNGGDDWSYWTSGGGKSQVSASTFTITGVTTTTTTSTTSTATTNGPPVVTGFSADKSSPQTVGSTVTFTATASDPDAGDTVLFRFYRLKLGAGSWNMVQDWSAVNTYAWTPSEVGDYQFAVWIRDGKHAGPAGGDDWSYWTAGGGKSQTSPSTFTVVAVTTTTTSTTSTTTINSPPVITGLSADKSSPQPVGTTITFTATATDPDGDTVLYRFYRLKSGGSWTIVRDWSSSNTYAWTASEAGDYQFAVWIRDGYHQGPSGGDDWSYWTVGGGKSQTSGSVFTIQ